MDFQYSQAKSAPMATAKVAADGTSTSADGITTSRVATGEYDLTLPENEGLDEAENLVFIQPAGSSASLGPTATRFNSIADTSARVKRVSIRRLNAGGTSLEDVDSAFDVFVLRQARS